MSKYKAGDSLSVWRNQAEREAEVLAVLGDKMIVEYSMPSGSSQLLIGDMDDAWEGLETVYSIKPVSYGAVSKKWRDAIFAQSGGWIGKGQTQPKVRHFGLFGGRRKAIIDIEPAPLFKPIEEGK